MPTSAAHKTTSSPAVDPDRVPHTTLPHDTWLDRHGLVSIGFAAFITIVVAWTAAAGHSGAELLAYVAPLLVAGVIATRDGIREDLREAAVVFGLLTAAALAANFGEDSILNPLGYFLALGLASLYERTRTLVFALVLIAVHEALFGTVVPDGLPVSDLPLWLTTVAFGVAFLVTAAVLSVPWRANATSRRRERQQRALIQDQLAVSEIVIGVSTDGLVTLISDHGLMVLGRGRDEVIGADFFELVVQPEQMEAARAGHARFIAAGRELAAPAFYEFEHAIIAGSGERRIFLWRVTVSCEGDRVLGTLASGFDITEVRRAQRQLQREQRDLAHLQQLAQSVARQTDARDSVVRGIESLVDASIAGLFEPGPGGNDLVLTHCTRPELVGNRVPIHGAPSGTAIAYSTGDPFFVADAADSALINQELRKLSGSTSFLYHPVICDGHAAGVLAVGWEERVADLGTRKTNLVALAAEETASALQRLSAMRRWEEAAMTDVLTGIPNRRAFDLMFEDALAHARTEDQPLAVALMDLNGFKALNDTEGHAAGDRVLKESASLWLQELRPTDVLARLGGDEFAVLLPNCGSAFTESVASRLRHALRHEAGCGVGVAVWNGSEPPSALLHRADDALYADKARRGPQRLIDPARVAAVEATGLMGPGTDHELDELASTITTLLGVPVSLISLLDDEQQKFAGQCGLEIVGVHEPEIPWEGSFCRHPVATGRPLIINDVAEHPLVAGVPIPAVPDQVTIGAYAGIPIIDDDGRVLGSTCAVDIQPHVWTPDELATLRSVAARATQIITQRTRTHG